MQGQHIYQFQEPVLFLEQEKAKIVDSNVERSENYDKFVPFIYVFKLVSEFSNANSTFLLISRTCLCFHFLMVKKKSSLLLQTYIIVNLFPFSYMYSLCLSYFLLPFLFQGNE